MSDRQAKMGFRRLAPWLSRLVMFPPIIIFTVISLRYFTNPSHATSGTTLHTPEAFTDTRVIGAWALTLLIMLITFLFSNRRLWLGHVQLALFMAATLIVRIFGFVHDSTTLAMGNQRIITTGRSRFFDFEFHRTRAPRHLAQGWGFCIFIVNELMSWEVAWESLPLSFVISQGQTVDCVGTNKLKKKKTWKGVRSLLLVVSCFPCSPPRHRASEGGLATTVFSHLLR